MYLYSQKLSRFYPSSHLVDKDIWGFVNESRILHKYSIDVGTKRVARRDAL